MAAMSRATAQRCVHGPVADADQRGVSPTGFAEMAEMKGFEAVSDDQATGKVDRPALT
jgi:hypothetical protein